MKHEVQSILTLTLTRDESRVLHEVVTAYRLRYEATAYSLRHEVTGVSKVVRDVLAALEAGILGAAHD